MIAGELGFPIYATGGTAEMLTSIGIPCQEVGKDGDDDSSALSVIRRGTVDLVINIPREFDEHGRPDGYLIRRCAVDCGVPLITDLQLARAVIEALRRTSIDRLSARSWREFLGRDARPLM